MKPILVTAITIVNVALLSYAAAIILLSLRKTTSSRILFFLTAGVILDITSTICMIIASERVISLHGVIGYSSLAGMLADTIVIWLAVKRSGINTMLPAKIIRWSQAAFAYWVLAYITGAILVMMK